MEPERWDDAEWKAAYRERVHEEFVAHRALRVAACDPEKQIADARRAYLDGLVDEVEFERRVEVALTVY